MRSTWPIVIALLLAAPLPAGAGEVEEAQVRSLRELAVPLRGIDPGDEDFSDLAPLAAVLSGVRVVQLGEQSHGDGAAFFAKARLIRFLHRELGFEVLAFESGLWDCRRTDEALASDVPLDEAIGKGIFPIWGASAHVKPVFEHARRTKGTKRPLVLAGVDCQFSSRGAAPDYVAWIRRFFEASEPEALGEGDLATLAALAKRLGEHPYQATREERERFAAVIDRLEGLVATPGGKLPAAHSAREIAFVRRTLGNLRVFERMKAEYRPGMSPKATNLRDRRMGENLLWLAKERFPGKKIIVWAASFHLMRNAPTIRARLDYADTYPMGHVVHEGLGEEVYTIAFTAWRGRHGTPFRAARTLPEAAPGSLEALLHATGKANLFLDLRGLPDDHWLRTPLVARPLGYSPMTADWSRVFDAFLFTDLMFPSTRDGAVPAGVRAK